MATQRIKTLCRNDDDLVLRAEQYKTFSDSYTTAADRAKISTALLPACVWLAANDLDSKNPVVSEAELRNGSGQNAKQWGSSLKLLRTAVQEGQSKSASRAQRTRKAPFQRGDSPLALVHTPKSASASVGHSSASSSRNSGSRRPLPTGTGVIGDASVEITRPVRSPAAGSSPSASSAASPAVASPSPRAHLKRAAATQEESPSDRASKRQTLNRSSSLRSASDRSPSSRSEPRTPSKSRLQQQQPHTPKMSSNLRPKPSKIEVASVEEEESESEEESGPESETPEMRKRRKTYEAFLIRRERRGPIYESVDAPFGDGIVDTLDHTEWWEGWKRKHAGVLDGTVPVELLPLQDGEVRRRVHVPICPKEATVEDL